MNWIVTTQQEPGVVVVHCHGELDLATRPLLESSLSRISEQAAPTGTDAVVVDLSTVRFMDCAALGILISLARRCRTAQRPFLLAAPTPVVRRLLQALGLDRALLVTRSLDEAIALARTWRDVGPAPGGRLQCHRRPPWPDRQAEPAQVAERGGGTRDPVGGREDETGGGHG